MKKINLKEEEESSIEQYVDLRNSYAELLLTLPVNVLETKEWLKRNDIEIRGFAQDNVLIGVVILYLSKDGEITFFVRYPNQGIGRRLLKIIEKIAKERKLRSVWAWVRKDNFIAQKVFEKNGFIKQGMSEKGYRGNIRPGIKYKKILANGLQKVIE